MAKLTSVHKVTAKKINKGKSRLSVEKRISSLSHDDLILLSDAYSKRDRNGKNIAFRGMPKAHFEYLSKNGAEIYYSMEKSKDSAVELSRLIKTLEAALKCSEKIIEDKVPLEISLSKK